MVNLETKARQCLKEFDLRTLFIEEMGWDHHVSSLEVYVDGFAYTLNAVAQKRGMVVFVCPPVDDGPIPDYPTRRKIEKQVAKSVHEHLIIYTDKGNKFQIWQWVKREAGKPSQCREHRYYCNQPGDSLLQKVNAIAFSLEEEEGLTIVDVATRVRAGFDVDRVTKRFYDRFKSEHDTFLKFLKGIPDEEMQRWYASVMLNRLMFIYFIQKRSFLDDNINYLRDKLANSKQDGKDRFYKDFLCPLFFEGFAKKEGERKANIDQLLGKVPFLNGGIFQPHQLEELYSKSIQIADAAFEKLFNFFDQYQWHLDERPLRADNEINPDVLGYIFEKYINQKQMGAYYTKEDITEYISKNTVIPYLFDEARKKCKIAFEGDQSVWGLLQTDPDRYIYNAVKKGVGLPLPPQIAAGINDVSKRAEWNKPAPEEYALPTEIWREMVTRSRRYEEVRSKLLSGEIQNINDLITYNLNIRQFAQDVIENCEGPELLRAFWHAIEEVTILDPACGSGAFLFAALNILEPLYEACLERMEVFLDELERSGEKHRPEKFSDFRKVLERIESHPNRRYFIFKSIIVNNLYGVDIMEEAIEICKLRLFLKLVAQIEYVENIEPLPDIDFNIRAGNTLVGYATYDEVKSAVLGKTQGKLDLGKDMQRIDEKAQDVDRLFGLFRQQQTELGGQVSNADKQELRKRLKALEDELNRYLAGEYGIDPDDGTSYENWLVSHKPFHWFIEFYGIVKNRGGFDTIIGNPPYVEYNKIRKEYTIHQYESESCGNLYAYVTERAVNLINERGTFGFILPISIVCTQRMVDLQKMLFRSSQSVWFSNFAERPSKLFVGSEVLLTITLARKEREFNCQLFTTGFTKWSSTERNVLFDRVEYRNIQAKIKPYVIPKIGSEIESSIIKKVNYKGGQLGRHLLEKSKNVVFYRIGGGRYWKIFTSFQPRFVLNGKESVSSRENYLFLETSIQRDAVISVLSSSLFYWYFILTTNCRDLNPSDLNDFPINLDKLTEKNLSLLANLCSKLMRGYKEKSQLKEKTSSLTGNIVYQEFYPRMSKPIIDEIDCALADYYDLSDKESDFIINYDIKYRMGRDTGEETEEE
jgi:type I restriction-modification system DNA methylase subunit